jgi:hypothetical protein
MPREPHPQNGALFHAASSKDMDRLRLALAAGADPLGSDFSGRTALMLAAEADWPDGVEVLLPLSDPRAIGSHGHNALGCGAIAGGERLAKLLAPVCDAGELVSGAIGAAHRAVAAGNAPYARVLLPLAPKDDLFRSDASIFHTALDGEHEELALLALDQLAGDEEARAFALSVNSAGRTPLMFAVSCAQNRAAERLLPFSDLTRKSQRSGSLLRIAVIRGDAACVDLIAKALPADQLEEKDADELTLADFALRESRPDLADLIASRFSLPEQLAILAWLATQANRVDLPKTRALVERAELGLALESPASGAAESAPTADQQPNGRSPRL